MFPDLKITNEGKAMMLRVIEGEPLKFTRIVLGNGVETENQDLLQYVQNECASAKITNFERTGSVAKLHWAMNTEDVENNFDWKEYGLYASSDLDENGVPVPGTDKLFSYAYNIGKAQPISSNNEITPIQIEADVNIAIGTSENINAVVSEYSAYASKEDFRNHLKDNKNPHNVTAFDVGLGNVDNTSDSDAVPEFTEHKKLENLISGETASVLWGKMKRLFTSFLNHLNNGSNPHNTTAADVGAAKEDHSHSAADINDGVLNESRGGTGYPSVIDMLKAYGLDSMRLKTFKKLDNYNGYLLFEGTNLYFEWRRFHLSANANSSAKKEVYADYKKFKAPPIIITDIGTASPNRRTSVDKINNYGYTVYFHNITNEKHENYVYVFCFGFLK